MAVNAPEEDNNSIIVKCITAYSAPKKTDGSNVKEKKAEDPNPLKEY